MYRLLSVKQVTTQNVRLGIKNALGNVAVAQKKDLLEWELIRSAGYQGTRVVYSQLLQHKNWKPVLKEVASKAATNCGNCDLKALQQPFVLNTCSLENSTNLTAISRQQSTTTTQLETIQEKKKKKTRKSRNHKYVDLLEVTDKAANERKSKVKRLKAKKLQEFILKTKQQIFAKLAAKQSKNKVKSEKKLTSTSQPIEYQKLNVAALESPLLEVGPYDDKPLLFLGKEQYTKHVFSNAEDVKNILKSFNNFREIIDTINNETLEHDDFILNTATGKTVIGNELHTNPLETLEPYVAIDTPVPKTKQQPNVFNKTKSRFKSKVHSNEEQERLAKEYAIRTNLNCYLTVCANGGMLNRGLSTLISYRQRDKSKNIITIELYNILLHGYAEKGAYDKFKIIFSLINEDGLKFNAQTFAAIFECLGRLEPSSQFDELIKQYIDSASELGFTLNQIMDSSKFIADQRDIALDAIRRIKPNFVPNYTPPKFGYNNVLLNNLNEHLDETTKSTATVAVAADTTDNIVDGNNVSSIMNSKRGFTSAQFQEMAKEQLKIELDGILTIKSIEKSKEFVNAEICRERLKELEEMWRTQIQAAITRDLNTMRMQTRFKPAGFMNYYTYLKALDTKYYADIVIQEIYKLAEGSETFSPTVGQLYRELGEKVQQRYQIEQKKQNGILEKMGEIYNEYLDLWHESKTNDNTRQMWQRLVHNARNSGPSMDYKEISWPMNVLSGVGRFLYNIMMRDIKIDAHVMRLKSKNKPQQNQQHFLPAFYTLFRNQGRLVKEEVKPHPVLARLLRGSQQKILTFNSNLVPMLCPPQPWSTPHTGGYLLNKSDLIRLPFQAIQQWNRINAADPQTIYPALDSLNQLASIPWRVNTDILDVIIEVFQNGGDDKLNVAQPPSSLPSLPAIPEKNASISNAERAKIFQETLVHRRRQAEMYSLWCDTLYRLSLANHYRDKVFWLPHNMDFRGRVYPLPPHLNHLGSDLARSMLVFDQAQPLGVDGFSWLKLHCINLTGLKKRNSIRERLLYAEEVMDEILDSADNPLTGRMWWSKSDEPWQTLACCMEIAKVKRCANPETYLSRFPVHQDGSCNGLQHYAALGRDKAGAFSVNLSPSKVPQDVYSTVAVLVEKARELDAKNGLHVAQALDGFVRRKVIKQTVMTTVYGVTRYGARLQIARQLKDIDDFPTEWVWPASTYLTTKTFESLREMFTSTREIQDWFTECARLISGVRLQNVEWITPLDFPIVQPYNKQDFKNTTRTCATISDQMGVDMYERPNILKQKNAFPPNFIHSLDSSHMMLTSLHCERKGLTFVSVHDCFWTHACTVPDMNTICRNQFVALHSQPILEDLSKFLKNKYIFNEKELVKDASSDYSARSQLNRVLSQVPEKGDFDLRNILESVYFFS